MKRRDFSALLGGAALAPLALSRAASAQQGATPVIGYLHSLSAVRNAHVAAAFRRGLNDAGFVEGQSVQVEYRWAEGQVDRLPAMAADLVRRPVNLIAAAGGTPPVLAAMASTTSIPIVFMGADADPVRSGIVASLARPGGNVTGLSLLGSVLGAKRLAILRELVPSATVIAMLVNPRNRNAEPDAAEIAAAVQASGQRLVVLHASEAGQLSAAFDTLVREKADALVLTSDGIFTNERLQIIALAERHRIPTIYQFREFAQSGGLISYGTSLSEASRQLGVYAGRILKGAKPADLPVLQPTTFELVINLKTAKAQGIEIPSKLLFTADEVIE
jgi:putative ABC transport system substrate-binding protein